jgi:hypothetical protein
MLWPPGLTGGPGTAARTDTLAGGTVDASGVNSLFGHNDIQDIQNDLNTLRGPMEDKGLITMLPLKGGTGVPEIEPNWTCPPPRVNNSVPIN